MILLKLFACDNKLIGIIKDLNGQHYLDQEDQEDIDTLVN